jgi:3-isopropylmalate/(R)-2-methylmalate dehydratase large subunit
MARTLYDKLWDSHVVREDADGTALIYIDRHLVHEVTSPQAFEGLKLQGASRGAWLGGRHRRPQHADQGLEQGHRRPDLAHAGRDARRQHPRARRKAYFPFLDRRQGIVHVIGPEQGARCRHDVVCGDSHTSTHGAFGALAFGIGTSEVEHVLATQCLVMKKARSMQIRVDGRLAPGVTAKDLVLAIIGRIGTAGGTGYAIEFAGDVVRSLSMESRMTMCNMAIEAGARAGMVAVDQKTIDYIKGRPLAPTGALWDARWLTGARW